MIFSCFTEKLKEKVDLFFFGGGGAKGMLAPSQIIGGGGGRGWPLGPLFLRLFIEGLGNPHADQMFRTTAELEGKVWIQ